MSAVIKSADFLGGTIYRPDLRDELRLLAEESGCRLVEFSSVSAIDPTSGTVHFETEKQSQADLIVAADGVHSSAMDLVLGEVFPATPSDFTATRAVVPTKMLRQSPCASIFADQPGRTTFSISPKGGGYLLCYWCHAFEYINIVLYRYGIEDDPNLAKEKMRDEATRAHVAESLEHFHPDLGTVCDHLLDVLPLWRLKTRPPALRYTRGRLVVIGDAAHAMLSVRSPSVQPSMRVLACMVLHMSCAEKYSYHWRQQNLGQGANSAILDAAALGTLFADMSGVSADDISSRLQVYDKIRSPRLSAIQIWSQIPMFEKPWRKNDEVRKYLPNSILPGKPS